MEIHPGKGVLKEEMFPNTRKHSHCQVCGEFWNLRGQHNQEEKLKKKLKLTNYMPYSNSQHLASATSKQGLNREVWAALLRVRTGPEYPENNLRELI